MPIIKSAIKRVKQATKRRERNVNVKKMKKKKKALPKNLFLQSRAKPPFQQRKAKPTPPLRKSLSTKIRQLAVKLVLQRLPKRLASNLLRPLRLRRLRLLRKRLPNLLPQKSQQLKRLLPKRRKQLKKLLQKSQLQRSQQLKRRRNKLIFISALYPLIMSGYFYCRLITMSLLLLPRDHG